MRRRGTSLATTLMALSVLATVAFALAANSLQHLRVGNRLSNQKMAHNLAQSAISQAIERLLRNPAYGRTPGTVVEVTHPGAPAGSRGVVTFDPGTLPYSTNNLSGDGSVQGYGRVVPAASAHLVGTGTCRGVVRRVEAVVYVPRFPYAIASSGPLRSTGGLRVASVASVADLALGISKVDSARLLPGHLSSLSVASDAIQLGPETMVTGDLQARGGIRVDPAGSVLGEIRPFSDGAPIPRISIAAYDPVVSGRPGIATLTSSTLTQPVFEGWLRKTGDLLVTGGLKLDGGALYVDGNLQVNGGVSGQGALIVTGNATIVGQTALVTDNEACLMAGGNISITGLSKEASYFQGLMYTEGDFTADHLTLVGTFIANSQDADGSKLTINDANVIQTDELASIEIPIAPPSRSPLPDLKIQIKMNPDGTFNVRDEHSANKEWEKAVRITEAGSPPITAALNQYLKAHFPGYSAEDFGKRVDYKKDGQELEVHYHEKDGPLDEIVPPTFTPRPDSMTLKVDPSSFLTIADNMRLLLWKDL